MVTAVKKWLWRIFAVLILVFVLVQVWIFTSLLYWRSHPVETTMFMRIYYYSSDEPHLHHQWRDYNRISSHFKRAVVAAEDAHFIDHHGFDFDGMINAAERNAKAGEVVAGGSTISQQLAKNLFLFNRRSYIRKGEEAIATWMMEKLWTKQRILEVYMNSVELGDGIYGVQAASRYYFGRNADQLTREQAIKLAAMLPNPKYYQQHRRDSKYLYRQRFISKYIRYARIPAND